MRRFPRIPAATALALLVTASMHDAAAFEAAQGYRFVLVGGIASDSERARILAMGNGSRARTIQGGLCTDPSFLIELRKRGLSLRNVIGGQRAGNGRVIVYVR